jgi:alkylation response protein AidB-like acyl-CoA dehydrogenase
MGANTTQITAGGGALRAWLTATWDADLALTAWRTRLVESGWACPTWPVEWHGRGLDDERGALVEEELAAAGAVGPPPGFGRVVAAPTLLDRASDDQKRKHLYAIATGAEKWCELFSELACGSDLAAVTTSAQPRDGAWVVTGRKAWATGAHLAQYALLLARTDWDVPKHHGLTMFVLPLDRPGVAVASVRLINGAVTHEVRLDGVVLHADEVIGAPGEGWSVAQTTLGHERRLAAAHRMPPAATGAGRAVREAAEEHAAFAEVYSWLPASRGRPDLLGPRLRSSGAADAATRRLVADAFIHERVATITARRAATGRVSPSLIKLASSQTARRATDAHAALSGAQGLLAGSARRSLVEIELSVHAASLIGGTDEIQHNIVAERTLGLPRDRAAVAPIPFRDVPTNHTERLHGPSALSDA